jgi:hypothetical protein
MNINARIKITSLHTSNYVIREIQNQEQLEKYRKLDGYGIEVLPVVHNNMAECESCSA